MTTSKQDISLDPFPKEAVAQYEKQFYSHLMVVNQYINTKGLKQKAFMRAITAALKNGVVPESEMHQLNSEAEAQMAGILGQLIDLKYILMANKTLQEDKLKQTQGVSNGNGNE
jgi:hypothetical protein